MNELNKDLTIFRTLNPGHVLFFYRVQISKIFIFKIDAIQYKSVSINCEKISSERA